MHHSSIMLQSLYERASLAFQYSRASFVSSYPSKAFESITPPSRPSSTSKADTATTDGADSSCLPIDIVQGVLTFATLATSPLLHLLAQHLHPQSSVSLQRVVDRYWASLPAITQEMLYEGGYRNAELERLTPKSRSCAFPAAPNISSKSPRLPARRLSYNGRDSSDDAEELSGKKVM